LVGKALSDQKISQDSKMVLEEIIWLADSFYDIKFKHDSDFSEQAIFPISDSESRDIEDVRFMGFFNDYKSQRIIGTYTAYNGHTTLPKTISTEDFYTFSVMPLYGAGAQNKNLALYPRKIKGKYAMLSRIDGVNNYLMFSEKLTQWDNPVVLQ
jgi:predicted GH43/DUF377 family glycosyl hydrolase